MTSATALVPVVRVHGDLLGARVVVERGKDGRGRGYCLLSPTEKSAGAFARFEWFATSM